MVSEPVIARQWTTVMHGGYFDFPTEVAALRFASAFQDRKYGLIEVVAYPALGCWRVTQGLLQIQEVQYNA